MSVITGWTRGTVLTQDGPSINWKSYGKTTNFCSECEHRTHFRNILTFYITTKTTSKFQKVALTPVL